MNRRDFGKLGMLALVLSAMPGNGYAQESGVDFFDVINKRHSVRAYTEEAISNEDIESLLRSAMRAPSAANEQPWEFVVIRDKAILEKVGGINSWARYANKAPVAILVCLNEQKEKEKGMGILDIGMCSENIMLAATAMGIGSVFTGIYPYKDRMDGFRKLCNLPDYIEPIGLIILGKPKIEDKSGTDRFNPAAIHQNTWQN